ncbi:MAG: DUF5320 domain-containing protein [Anaerolineaceae bacterium]|nr:DUF5320 domain-containing protein [Anaerolineaceae bacterium]
MPGRDGTGPTGQGSRTGRGLGNCAPGYIGNDQAQVSTTNRPYRSFGFWESTIGRLFKRRRGNRYNNR